MTQITVQNLSTVITDEEAQAITAALNVQATRDFNSSQWVKQHLAEPIGSVMFIPKVGQVPASWHLEILDTSPEEGALGFHEEQAFDNHPTPGEPGKASARSARGLRADAPDLPLMKVFAKTSKEDGASLSEVCSHEMLEAAVDPRPMREPRIVVDEKNQNVIVEVGDPVQECGYQIDGVTVADFALPSWFGFKLTDVEMSFRESVKQPFELAPGGYISVCPVGTESWEQVFGNAAAEVSLHLDGREIAHAVVSHYREHQGELRQLKREVKHMSTAIQDIAADAAKLADVIPQLATLIEQKDQKITELQAKIDSGETVDPAETQAAATALDSAVAQAEALIPAPPAPVGPTGPVFTLTAGDPVPAGAEASGFQTVPAEGEAEALYYSPNGEVEGLIAYTGETAPVA